MSTVTLNDREQSDVQRIRRGASSATPAFPRGALVLIGRHALAIAALTLAFLAIGCARSAPSTVEMEQAYEALEQAWPEYEAAYNQLKASVVIHSNQIDVDEEYRLMQGSLRTAASHTAHAAEMPKGYLDSIKQLVDKGNNPSDLATLQLPERFLPEAVEQYGSARQEFIQRRRAWFQAVARYAEQR